MRSSNSRMAVMMGTNRMPCALVVMQRLALWPRISPHFKSTSVHVTCCASELRQPLRRETAPSRHNLKIACLSRYHGFHGGFKLLQLWQRHLLWLCSQSFQIHGEVIIVSQSAAFADVTQCAQRLFEEILANRCLPPCIAPR